MVFHTVHWDRRCLGLHEKLILPHPWLSLIILLKEGLNLFSFKLARAFSESFASSAECLAFSAAVSASSGSSMAFQYQWLLFQPWYLHLLQCFATFCYVLVHGFKLFRKLGSIDVLLWDITFKLAAVDNKDIVWYGWLVGWWPKYVDIWQ